MTAHTFVLCVVLGAAALAFWLGARFPHLGPDSLSTGVIHLLLGFAAVRAIPGLTNAVTAFAADAARFVAPFVVALPLFTYAFLTGLWLTRLIHRSTSGFSS